MDHSASLILDFQPIRPNPPPAAESRSNPLREGFLRPLCATRFRGRPATTRIPAKRPRFLRGLPNGHSLPRRLPVSLEESPQG